MSIHHPQYFVLVVLLAAGLLGAGQAAARFDHNEIRRLYRAGTILSLDAIVAKHRRRYPGGQLLEAELEFERNRYVYDLKIIDDDGVVREFEYDAASGELWHLEDKK
ncbi:MAG TPA: PepSY domain-containing protein [Candidatus Competibacter sp.]|nr:PepSY domain-containing protein [Candidatus Competibacter sp.]